MPTLEDVWAEVELDYAWRTDEIRFLRNQLTNLKTEEQKDQFRRSIVLMLYAHFEGFCKFTLTLYVDTINRESIKCEDATYAIVAASLADLFEALHNSDKKNKLFKSALPADEKLHRVSRHISFVEESEGFLSRVVAIPDDVVDTESNLKPVVLRKNLFRLGFPYTTFDFLEGDISKLLYHRNNISHGKQKEGISSDLLESLHRATYRIMDGIKTIVMQALTDKKYLKAS